MKKSQISLLFSSYFFLIVNYLDLFHKYFLLHIQLPVQYHNLVPRRKQIHNIILFFLNMNNMIDLLVYHNKSKLLKYT